MTERVESIVRRQLAGAERGLDLGDVRRVADADLDLAEFVLGVGGARVDLPATIIVGERAVRLDSRDRAASHEDLAGVGHLIAAGDQERNRWRETRHPSAMDRGPDRPHAGRMRNLLVLVLVGGCSLYSGSDSPPDAGVQDVAPVACESVAAICGPRPPRPAPDVERDERWAHDIDLWAKCAENAR